MIMCRRTLSELYAEEICKALFEESCHDQLLQKAADHTLYRKPSGSYAEVWSRTAGRIISDKQAEGKPWSGGVGGGGGEKAKMTAND